jgi:hypothetical protein
MQPDTICSTYGIITLQYMPFNSASSDFGAVFWNNGIVFTSDRINSLVRYSSEDNKPFTDIFFVEQKVKGKWKPPVSFSSEINSRCNEGPLSYSGSGDTIFFSRNVEHGKLGIFRSILNNNGKWIDAGEMPFNSEEYSVAHPCISFDGQELYFCSDMSGGFGGKDIYVSRIKNGTWSTPENLGNTINTSDDEMFPFISREGTLYFASDGHPGMGGLDIFSSEMKNGKWNPISNLQIFNSVKDDFSFLLDTNSRRGLFTSNRVKEDDDIYYFEIIEPLFSAPDTLKENIFCLTIFEETTAMADTLPYVYEWNLGEGLMVKAKEVHHCFPGPGTYPVYLNILDTLTGLAHESEAEYLIEIKVHEHLYITCSDTFIADKAISFDASSSNLPGYTIKNYFWDFGDGLKGTGINPVHTYREGGAYYVRLGSELLSTDKQELKKSVVKKIVVLNKDQNQSYEK